MPPFISICIPAYKRIEFLKVLLNSISKQTFKDFEVVITDDSSDNEVLELQNNYSSLFSISYQKNAKSLGTPENWNEAIRLAKGEWIKIMHDDDWFAFPDSLEKFVELIQKDRSASFLFSGSAFLRDNKVFGGMHINRWELKLLKKNPQNLYYKNFIGPPSVTMYKNTKDVWFDPDMKWLVDIDFYMRYLSTKSTFTYTELPLVNIVFSADQVTEKVQHDKTVFVKENLKMLEKVPHTILKKIWNYDYTWRMMRNYNIKNVRELQELYPPAANNVPDYHRSIILFQKYIPTSVLKIGLLSKILMTVSFAISRLKIKEAS